MVQRFRTFDMAANNIKKIVFVKFEIDAASIWGEGIKLGCSFVQVESSEMKTQDETKK